MAKVIKNNCQCGGLKDHRAKICQACLWKDSDLNIIKEKQCTKCKLILPIENFRTKSRNGKVRPRSWCKKCESKDCMTRARNQNPLNPVSKISLEERKLNKLKSLIKLRLKSLCPNTPNIEDYVNQYIEQKTCQICESHINDLGKLLTIDHCHSSGKFRGFLCGKCNSGLGMFKDNVANIQKAFEYLQRYYS